MWRKFVLTAAILLLFYAVGLSTFNFVNSHELAGLWGGDFGTLKSEATYVREQINVLKEGVGVSHTAIKTLAEEQRATAKKYKELWDKVEKNYKDIDHINARVNEVIYHRTWEIKKKIRENRTNLIRQGIWKE